jgi:hypothetical protein
MTTTMLGRHWNRRHPSPPNSGPGLLALRNHVASRYFGHGGGATPPPAEFGGEEAPGIHGYAVESWLLRNKLIGVELNPPAADGRCVLMVSVAAC